MRVCSRSTIAALSPRLLSMLASWCTSTLSVRDLEAFDSETIAYLDESTRSAFTQRWVSAFGQPLESHKADAIVFVGEIWPNNVIEYVSLDCEDGER